MENQKHHLLDELVVEVLEGVRVPFNGLIVLKEVCNQAGIRCIEQGRVHNGVGLGMILLYLQIGRFG